MSRSPGAAEMLTHVADPGTWRSWDQPIESRHDTDYEDELERVRAGTGYDEAVITGSAQIRGHRIALIVGEFGFLAGSIGVDAGARIAEAFHRATAEGLPVLALPTSGGTRMQEGTTAFVQMVRITAAVNAHKAACLPYLVYLRHPTTGGVLASWGSLGHITLAEPEALVGFLGPRVFRALTGDAIPDGVQTAENLRDHGVVDAVVPADRLGAEVGSILDILCAPASLLCAPPSLLGAPASLLCAPASLARHGSATRPSAGSPSSWECVTVSRDPRRPGALDLLGDSRVLFTRVTGSGEGDVDDAVVLGLARIDGRSCVVVAQDRTSRTSIGVAGLRIARRGIRLAEELRLPVVTVVDTAGADLSRSAEESGLAGQIARCLASMTSASVPTVSILLGQGGGGAALALLPADRVLAAEHGWLSPLPPEGASAIVYRTVDHAEEMADRQGIGSAELLETGFVDEVVPESLSAAEHPAAFRAAVLDTLSRHMTELGELSDDDRTYARLQRFDRLGSRVMTTARV